MPKYTIHQELADKVKALGQRIGLPLIVQARKGQGYRLAVHHITPTGDYTVSWAYWYSSEKLLLQVVGDMDEMLNVAPALRRSRS